VRFSCSREKATTSAEELKKDVVAQEPALDSHKSDFRHGIVNKLKNQQQITVLQLSRYYHVEARIPSHAGTVRKALRSVNFGE
jgi:hypothetical protein